MTGQGPDNASAPAAARIAGFTAGLSLDDVPPQVVEKAKVTVLHDLGVALAGHHLAGPAYQVAKELGAVGGTAGARLLADGTTVGVEAAALATGALIHARTQDDTQVSALTHLGATTLPALLAIGDRDDAAGADFLLAMIAGYEVSTAVANDHAKQSMNRGFRPTAVYGPIGAAAAVSKLLGLDAGQTTAAIGLAAAMAGGTSQTWITGTQEWMYQPGTASRHGLVAATLARHGVTGAPDCLEGDAGLLRSFAGEVAEPARLGAGLGHTWGTTAVTFKPFPVCALNQIPVTLLLDILASNQVDAGDIESIDITLPLHEAHYPGLDAHGPFAEIGSALMSAPWCAAVAAVRGQVTLSEVNRFDSEAYRALAKRVTLLADDHLVSGQAAVAVRTSQHTYEGSFQASGTTFNWNRDEVLERLLALADDLPFGADRLRKLAEVILSLDSRMVRDLIEATLP